MTHITQWVVSWNIDHYELVHLPSMVKIILKQNEQHEIAADIAQLLQATTEGVTC